MGGSGCELPCWNGIVPGETAGEDAAIILTSLGYGMRYRGPSSQDYNSLVTEYIPPRRGLCVARVMQQEDTVEVIELRECPKTTRIGDLLTLLGEPNASLISMDEYRIIAREGAVNYTPDLLCGDVIAPNTRLRALRISALSDNETMARWPIYLRYPYPPNASLCGFNYRTF